MNSIFQDFQLSVISVETFQKRGKRKIRGIRRRVDKENIKAEAYLGGFGGPGPPGSPKGAPKRKKKRKGKETEWEKD